MASATVYIWLPTGIEHALGIGHGSLELKKDNGETLYITWLNSRGGSSLGGGVTSTSREASKRVGFATIKDPHTGKIIPNPDRVGAGKTFNLDDDMKSNLGRFPKYIEMGLNEAPPNYFFDLPICQILSLGPQDTPFGVSARRIERFWKNLLALPPGDSRRYYGALSTKKNCNGVVVEALLAGGLWLYADPPSNIVYQDARTLLRWVEKAQGSIDEKNKQHQKIAESQARVEGDDLGQLPQTERTIPTLKEWKTLSEQGIAWYGRRKDQVAALDEVIPMYHRAKAQNDRPRMYSALFRMQWSIYDHLAHKPQSDRRKSMLALAKRLYAVLSDMNSDDDDQLIRLNPNPNQGTHAPILID